MESDAGAEVATPGAATIVVGAGDSEGLNGERGDADDHLGVGRREEVGDESVVLLALSFGVATRLDAASGLLCDDDDDGVVGGGA